MDYNQVTMTVTASLSDHDGEFDVADLALWTELQARIEALLSDARYDSIMPMSA